MREELLNSREVGKLLHLNERTVAKMGRMGILPCLRLGSRIYRFKKSVILGMLDSACEVKTDNQVSTKIKKIDNFRKASVKFEL